MQANLCLTSKSKKSWVNSVRSESKCSQYPMLELYFKNCKDNPVTVSSQAVLIFLPDYEKDLIKMLGSFLMYGSVAGEKKKLRQLLSLLTDLGVSGELEISKLEEKSPDKSKSKKSKKFFCRTCNAGFPYIGNLKNHIATSHNNPEKLKKFYVKLNTKGFKCQLCPELYLAKSTTGIDSHIARVHDKLAEDIVTHKEDHASVEELLGDNEVKEDKSKSIEEELDSKNTCDENRLNPTEAGKKYENPLYDQNMDNVDDEPNSDVNTKVVNESDGSAVNDGMIELERGEKEEPVPKLKADMSSEKDCGFNCDNDGAAKDSIDEYEDDKLEDLETRDLVIDEYAVHVEKRQNEDGVMEEVENSRHKVVNSLEVRDGNKIPDRLRRLRGLSINVFRN